MNTIHFDDNIMRHMHCILATAVSIYLVSKCLGTFRDQFGVISEIILAWVFQSKRFSAKK